MVWSIILGTTVSTFNKGNITNNLDGTKNNIVQVNKEFGTDMYTLLYLKWITNKDLLYSAENSPQCYIKT